MTTKLEALYKEIVGRGKGRGGRKRGSSRSTASYRLVSAESMARKAPRTFKIPSLKERLQVMPGDFVKLIFTSAGARERMWVKVTRTAGRRYEGKLDSKPSMIEGLRLGSSIRFGPGHIIEISWPMMAARR